MAVGGDKGTGKDVCTRVCGNRIERSGGKRARGMKGGGEGGAGKFQGKRERLSERADDGRTERMAGKGREGERGWKIINCSSNVCT